MSSFKIGIDVINCIAWRNNYIADERDISRNLKRIEEFITIKTR